MFLLKISGKFWRSSQKECHFIRLVYATKNIQYNTIDNCKEGFYGTAVASVDLMSTLGKTCISFSFRFDKSDTMKRK